MEEESRVFYQPFFHCGMVVSRVVVKNQMNIKTPGRLSINGAQKPKEFLMAMAR